MKDWTNKPPTRPGWYWRVVRGDKPRPYAIAREESPEYTSPIVTATGYDLACELIDASDPDILWSSKPLAPPSAPKWPKDDGIEVKP